ncbi:putative Major Facilitator Superfamily transporter [Fusarium austroafricanum]|uniref:Putative Major Facilitator Superfamily transporter n=1 Tax=Fusarium austroafricanum TaxID=2364996 RepID=A0A8H4NKG8_9HYPO|nr:putative Major Facilitator Superfamily transporter [Fusarium austroafricanum]
MQWAVAYAAMLSTTFLFALDNTIVANIQPSIVNDFGHLELISWIGTGFALGTMFILLWAEVYDVFNIKWVYLFNIFLFEAGSSVCGTAPNIETLIIGRIIAGVGGSGMYSGTLTYVSVLSSQKEKPAYLASSTVVRGIDSVLRPVISRRRICSEQRHMEMEKFRLVDWVNAVIFLAGSACPTVALTFGGVVYSFQSGAIIALWIVSGILLVAFIILLKMHPLVSKENRLYSLHFFKQPILVNTKLQVFLSSGIILAMTYYIPLYYQFIKGDGALEAGVRLLPLIMFMVAVSMLNGFLMPKHGLVPVWYIGGSALTLIGSALMCMVLFLDICGSIFHNVAVDRVGKALLMVSEPDISNLTAGTSSSAFKALSEADKNFVIPEIASAMKSIWAFFMAAAALSFVCSWPLLKTKLGGNKVEGGVIA